jgi:hypothetical protein
MSLEVFTLKHHRLRRLALPKGVAVIAAGIGAWVAIVGAVAALYWIGG